MKIIKHDLILTKDTTFKESIEVEGDIKGYYNLTVWGDIDAWNIAAYDINAEDIDAYDIDAMNINAEDIDAYDIKAVDIDAWNITAWDINARDIDAIDIICESRVKKTKTAKTICRVYVKNRSQLVRKERDLE